MVQAADPCFDGLKYPLEILCTLIDEVWGDGVDKPGTGPDENGEMWYMPCQWPDR